MPKTNIYNLPTYEEEKHLDYLQELTKQYNDFVYSQRNNPISLLLNKITSITIAYATASIVLPPMASLTERLISGVPYVSSGFSYKHFGQVVTILFLKPTADMLDVYRGTRDALKMLEFLISNKSKDNRYHGSTPNYTQTHLESIEKVIIYIQEALNTQYHWVLRTVVPKFSSHNSMVLVIEALDLVGHCYYRNNEIIKSKTTLLEAKTLCEKLLGNVDVKDVKKLYQALKTQSNLFTATPKCKDLNPKAYQALYLTELYISILYSLGKCYAITSPTTAQSFFKQVNNLCAEVHSDLKINLLYGRLVESNGLKPLALTECNKLPSTEKTRKAVREIKLYYKYLLDNNNVPNHFDRGNLVTLRKNPYNELFCLRKIIQSNHLLIKLGDNPKNYVDQNEIAIMEINKRINIDGIPANKLTKLSCYYSTIGEYYYLIERPNLCIEYFTKALNASFKENNITIGDAYYNLARACYFKFKNAQTNPKYNYDNAQKHLRDCLKIRADIFAPDSPQIIEVAQFLDKLEAEREKVATPRPQEIQVPNFQLSSTSKLQLGPRSRSTA